MQNPGSAGLVVEKFGDAEPRVSQSDKKPSFVLQRTKSGSPIDGRPEPVMRGVRLGVCLGFALS